MREQELIVYRTFQDGELLQDMAWLMSNYEELTADTLPKEAYRKGVESARDLLYDCIHRLIELAGTYGFHGNLWHCAGRYAYVVCAAVLCAVALFLKIAF